MFIEIHCLHTYIGALLNRDENGQAKRLTVGGADRTRISSQCLKRHWRMVEDEFSFNSVNDASQAVRSREIINELVTGPLRGDPEISEEVIDAVQTQFNTRVYGSGGANQSGRQSILLGFPEVEFLREKAWEICNQHPRDSARAAQAVEELFGQDRGDGRSLHGFLAQARMPYSATAAMHGRMITSDTKANIDSAVSVSHAFTVSAVEAVPDFFTAVDDLSRDDSPGSTSLLSHSELHSGIYYGCVVVNVKQLVSNTEGRTPNQWMDSGRELAAQLVHNLIRLISRVSPGAKKGSTAPFTEAGLVLVETGTGQPRSLAKAFLKPCEPDINAAMEALRSTIEKSDRAHPSRRERRFTSVEDAQFPDAQWLNIEHLAHWTAEQVRRGLPAEAANAA
jgi:CRISPR system Cascade subunit CasC